MRNTFSFTFLHYLRGTPSQPIDIDACVVYHMSVESKTNTLLNIKKGLENLMTFCKMFNHTDLLKHLERQEQLHEIYRKVKLHKNYSGMCITKTKNTQQQ